MDPALCAGGGGVNRRKLIVEPAHRHTLAECQLHLGRAWLAKELGVSAGPLDEGQELELQRIHAALRVELLDAQDHLEVVRVRLRELARDEATR